MHTVTCDDGSGGALATVPSATVPASAPVAVLVSKPGSVPVPGANPAPVRATVCGLPEASSAKARTASRVPLTLGVKVTLTVQVAPGATVAALQVSSLSAKSVLPVNVDPEMLSAPSPELVSVSVCGALCVPVAMVPKSSRPALSETTGAGPVPTCTERVVRARGLPTREAVWPV